jgi:hypothetical protein
MMIRSQSYGQIRSRGRRGADARAPHDCSRTRRHQLFPYRLRHGDADGGPARRPRAGQRGPQGHRHQQRCRASRHLPARRGARARRPDHHRHGSRHRRRLAKLDRQRIDARRQAGLVRVRAAQHHRQADRALAGGGPLQPRRLRPVPADLDARRVERIYSRGYAPERIRATAPTYSASPWSPGAPSRSSRSWRRTASPQSTFGTRSTTSSGGATATSSAASCWASPACSPSF